MFGCIGSAGELGGEPRDGVVDYVVDAGAPEAPPGHTSAIDGGETDAGTDVEPDAGSHPPHLAGSYSVAQLDFPIEQVNVREHAVSYDPAHPGSYVLAYVDAGGASGFRVWARSLRPGPSGPLTVAAVPVDDPLAQEFYSSQAVAAAGPEGLILVAFRSYRPVLAGGAYADWIYGQLLQTRADGRLERVGQNFIISSGSVNEKAPCVAWDDEAQTFLVAYSSAREHGQRPDGWILLARTVSVDGALGMELRMAGNELGQIGCNVSAGGGRFLVAWHEYLATGGLNFDTGYRARTIEDGQVGPELPALRVGMIHPDPPAIAWNARQDEWLIGYKVGRAIRGIIYRPDGSARVADRVLADPPDGSGVPHLAYSRRTNSYLLTYHAWDTNDASAQELDPDGSLVGPPLPLNDGAPPNGTYSTPVAASRDENEFLVVMMKDFARLNGTVFRAPASLP